MLSHCLLYHAPSTQRGHPLPYAMQHWHASLALGYFSHHITISYKIFLMAHLSTIMTLQTWFDHFQLLLVMFPCPTQDDPNTCTKKLLTYVVSRDYNYLQKTFGYPLTLCCFQGLK
jgi:hypothetical protein